MKKEKNMKNGRVCFFADAVEMGLPFVRVAEGDFEGLVFLVDTGSNDNIMFGFAHKELKDMLVDVEGTSSLYGIDGKETIVSHTSGKFTFCGKEYDMRFLLRDDDEAAIRLSKDVGFPVCGIIGTKFMVEHGWMIDFAHHEFVIPSVDVCCDDLKALRMKKN